jgi:hypothetical protein
MSSTDPPLASVLGHCKRVAKTEGTPHRVLKRPTSHHQTAGAACMKRGFRLTTVDLACSRSECLGAHPCGPNASKLDQKHQQELGGLQQWESLLFDCNSGLIHHWNSGSSPSQSRSASPSNSLSPDSRSNIAKACTEATSQPEPPNEHLIRFCEDFGLQWELNLILGRKSSLSKL